MISLDAAVYDVAVVGGGLPGSALAAVLARGGARVALLDRPSGPRPFRPEVSIPYQSLYLRVLARRYGVPQLADLAGYRALRAAVGDGVGPGRSLGFVYQREGLPQRAAECDQLATPRMVPQEAVSSRAGTEAYLLRAAVVHGACVVPVAKADLPLVARQHAGHIELTGGAVHLTARYVVETEGMAGAGGSAGTGSTDGGLLGGLLAPRTAAARPEDPQAHLSRTIRVGMAGVRPYDAIAPALAAAAPVPWSEGALHHLFDGGYAAILPLGGGPRATTGIELTVDPRRFPPKGGAEADFWAIALRFPQLEQQLARARAVTAFEATGSPQQYTADPIAGERWCRIGTAAGLVDPLLGLPTVAALEQVDAVAWRLLAALRRDRPGAAPTADLAAVARSTGQRLAADRRLLRTVAQATASYRLWKSVLRIWEVGMLYGTFRLQRAYGPLLRDGSTDALRALEDEGCEGAPFPGHEGYRRLLEQAADQCAAVTRGELAPDTAGERLLRELADSGLAPPPFGLVDPDERFYHPSALQLGRLALWARRGAPDEIGRLVLGAMGATARERRTRSAKRGPAALHPAAPRPAALAPAALHPAAVAPTAVDTAVDDTAVDPVAVPFETSTADHRQPQPVRPERPHP